MLLCWSRRVMFFTQPAHVIMALAVTLVAASMMPSNVKKTTTTGTATGGVIIKPGSFVNFVYLAAFCTHVGAQFWMTFISGELLSKIIFFFFIKNENIRRLCKLYIYIFIFIYVISSRRHYVFLFRTCTTSLYATPFSFCQQEKKNKKFNKTAGMIKKTSCRCLRSVGTIPTSNFNEFIKHQTNYEQKCDQSSILYILLLGTPRTNI